MSDSFFDPSLGQPWPQPNEGWEPCNEDDCVALNLPPNLPFEAVGLILLNLLYDRGYADFKQIGMVETPECVTMFFERP